MPPSRHLAFSLIVSLCMLLAGSGSGRAGAERLPDSAPAHPIPPAAQKLAARLGIRTHPYIGDQPRGAGRPWTIWLPPVLTRASVKRGRGQALFAGPRGALGEFHYFDLTPVSTEQAVDTYHGPPLTRARAIRIALRWLRHAGVPIPRGPMHVTVRRGTTDIGGTGLCCFASLAPIWWGTSSVEPIQHPAKNDVYVADTGIVVQVDIGSSAAAGAENPAYPCPGDHRDRHGIALGPWCFSYPAAARYVIFSGIGGHDGWRRDPATLADLPLSPILRHTRHIGPLHQLSLTANRAVYRKMVAGTTYQVTLVPAFPGLVGSSWETAFVQIVRTSKVAIIER